MDLDLIINEQLRFIPPNGADTEWPPVPDWTDGEWMSWMLQHNNYPYLRHWTEEEAQQYVRVDRYKYGMGFRRPQDKFYTYFYMPMPVAVPFHASKKPNLLFGGAAGGTKSHSARWDALKHGTAIPEFRAILMRRELEQLRRNHLDKIRGECLRMNHFLDKDIFLFNKQDHEVTIDAHGPGRESKIIFGHCQNPGDEEKYLGDSYDAFYPDEMATFEKTQIIGVAGRVRTEKRGVLARMAGTSNPGGAHTLWLKDYFIDKLIEKIREENPRYNPDDYEFLPAMLWDNPYYMDPDGTYTTYEARLFSYDNERRLQLLMGDWTALAGQFFPEFSDHTHVATLSIPPGCKIERWVDWGYDPHYGVCYWVACLPNGRLYVFYEYKFNGQHAKHKMVAAEVATSIKRYTFEDVFPMVQTNRISRSIADPSMWGDEGHTGEDYAETFMRNGVHLTKADHERVLGWGRLRHWFRLAPDGLPWLMVHPRCTTLIRTIPGLVRDKDDLDDINTAGEDHPADCLRYGVMARPTPTVLRLDLPIILPGTPAAIMQELMGTTIRGMGQVRG